jgi:hypothetical protein
MWSTTRWPSGWRKRQISRAPRKAHPHIQSFNRDGRDTRASTFPPLIFLPYSPSYLEKRSEKSRRCLRCCPTARRNGTFRSILPSVYRPNPRSERGSYPFSDSFRRGILRSPLRVELLLDHRLGRLLRGYGVCVTMHYLPGALFRSKDQRSPKSPRGDLLPSAYLGLPRSISTT